MELHRGAVKAKKVKTLLCGGNIGIFPLCCRKGVQVTTSQQTTNNKQFEHSIIDHTNFFLLPNIRGSRVVYLKFLSFLSYGSWLYMVVVVFILLP